MIRKLRKCVPAALNEGDAKAVHDARVSTRRLRAALELLGPVTSPKLIAPLRKMSRKLRRRLGPLRDLDVMVDSLRRLERRPRHTAAVGWAIEQLREARRQARRKAAKKCSADELLDRLDSWPALCEQIEQLGEGLVDGLMLASLRSQWDAFTAKANSRAENLFDESCDGDVPNPHELRIAAKMLRYTPEMVGDTGHPLPPLVRSTFKRMQNALGCWHDCVVLEQQLMRCSLEQSLAVCDPVMQRRVLELTRMVLRRGDRALRGFGALWRGNGKMMADSVERIVTQLQTDRGRDGSGRPAVGAIALPGARTSA